MSTFHVIASYAASVDPSLDVATVQRMLITENLRLLNYRYPRDVQANAAEAREALASIKPKPMDPLPPDSTIASELSCYDYQSCEHPGYPESPAGQLVAKLQQRIQQPKPAAVPVPAADEIESARARLAAMFDAPAAPEQEPEPPAPQDPIGRIPAAERLRALALLLTLARVSEGSPGGERFRSLADRIAESLSGNDRTTASAAASANVAALRAVWVAEGGANG